MFNKEKTTLIEKMPPSTATLIAGGTTLQGDVGGDNDLRIDGTINGNINTTAKIIIGPSGFVQGDISAQQADITGKVSGNISVADLLQLRGNADIQGNISAAKLQIDPTATFNGKCQMTGGSGAVVQMQTSDVQTAEAQ